MHFRRNAVNLLINALKNNFKSAREIQFRFLEMIELLFIEGNPAGVKAYAEYYESLPE